jgi:uncharacterized protein with HEPN domain
MRQCAIDAAAIVGTSDADAIRSDVIKRRALVNCFTEIGEAASRLSEQARATLGDLPWRQIIGMRNILVHMYWGIDLVELVKTTKSDLPGFVASLDSTLVAS